MSSEKDKVPPPPPKEVDIKGIVKPQPPTKESFNTSAEIRLDQSLQLFLKGKRYYDRDQIDDAINSLKSAVSNLKGSELGEETSTLYSYLGLSYLKKGWNSYAKAQFQLALNLNPKDPIALENMKYTNDNTKMPKTNAKPPSQTQIVEERGLIKIIKSIFVKKPQS